MIQQMYHQNLHLFYPFFTIYYYFCNRNTILCVWNWTNHKPSNKINKSMLKKLSFIAFLGIAAVGVPSEQ